MQHVDVFITSILDSFKSEKRSVTDEIQLRIVEIISHGIELSLEQLLPVYLTYGADTLDFCQDMITTGKGYLEPVQRIEKHYKIANAGNTCYLDSLLFALFAQINAFDYLLLKAIPNKEVSIMQMHLRFFVTRMRKSKAIMAHQVKALFDAMKKSGWNGRPGSQEDVVELLAWFMSVFESPTIALTESIYHGGESDMSSDERVSAERFLSLPIPEGKDLISLEELVQAYFFDNHLQGIKRKMDDKKDIEMNAWKMLRMLPFYCIESADTSGDSHFRRMMLPIVLKRYTNKGKRQKRPVGIPHRFDISHLVSQDHPVSYFMELQAAVCHVGGKSISSGHYVALCATDHEGELAWVKSDDLKKTESLASLANVQHIFVNDLALDSYILLYELRQEALECAGVDAKILHELLGTKKTKFRLFKFLDKF
jgi:hypothetical protein